MATITTSTGEVREVPVEDDRIGYLIKMYEDPKNGDQTDRRNIKDYTWMKNTFIITQDPNKSYSRWLDYRRFASTADRKFGSTVPGMSIACNPKPQITRYADIRRPGLIAGRGAEKYYRTMVPGYKVMTFGYEYGLGFGRTYSEVYDDHEQRIFMQFGEPQFMSMIFWIGKSFDVHKATMFRRGYISRTLLGAVNVFTKFWAIAATPWLYIGKYLLEWIVQPTQFVTLRETMYTYWTMVDTLVNKMFVRRARIPHLQAQKPTDTNMQPQTGINKNSGGPSAQFLKNLNSIVPDLVDAETGRLSVFALALRASSVFNRMQESQMELSDAIPMSSDLGSYEVPNGYVDRMLKYKSSYSSNFISTIINFAAETKAGSGGASQVDNDPSSGNTISRIANMMRGVDESGAPGLTVAETNMVPEEADMNVTAAIHPLTATASGQQFLIDTATDDAARSADGARQADMNSGDKQDHLDMLGRYMVESLRGGWGFAVFNVEPTGSVGESFSNSTETNPIETVFNSVSSKMRSMLNIGSSITEIPVIGDGIKFAASAASIAVSNLTFGLANPLLALLHGTTVNLPKHWAGSTASLPRASYKIRLGTPYGNAYSQLFHMYLPLAMLLPAALPRAVGLQTYVAPFMCRLMDPGRVNIIFGMVDDMSITRGVSNTAFNVNGHANAIDVEFSVVDLNEIIPLELGGSGVLTRFMETLLPDMTETALDNYINTVVGMDPYNMFYRASKRKLNMMERAITWQSLSDPAAQGAFLANALVPDILRGAVNELSGKSTPLVRNMTNL